MLRHFFGRNVRRTGLSGEKSFTKLQITFKAANVTLGFSPSFLKIAKSSIPIPVSMIFVRMINTARLSARRHMHAAHRTPMCLCDKAICIVGMSWK